MMETSSASMSSGTMCLPSPSARNSFRVDVEGRIIVSGGLVSRMAGSTRRLSSPPTDDTASRVERILEMQEEQEEQAGVAVFELIRSSLDLGSAGSPAVAHVVRTITRQIDRFTRPRLLVNLLMATYPLRSTLGDDRQRLVEAVEARLRPLLGVERATQLVDRLR
jgi:hypothetical protein